MKTSPYDAVVNSPKSLTSQNIKAEAYILLERFKFHKRFPSKKNLRVYYLN